MTRALRLCFFLFILVALGTLPGFGAENACANVAIPESVKALLAKEFPHWNIVTLRDLRSDDQELWVKAHGECPGAAMGHFEDAGVLSYALTLFRTSSQLKQVLIVVTPNGSEAPRWHVLSRPQEVAYLSVVHRTPPDTYSDVDGDSIVIRNDVILYEAIEAGSVAYYFSGGKYHSLQYTD